MPPPEKLIGIIGKTNVGKSTLFTALTMASVKIANHPFTTIEPNVGVGYVRKKCVHVELGLSGCNPRSGYCVKGYRFIPVKIIDVAGLIPGAHMGRGLGNKFMDDLRRADVLIHVVDASGSTDAEGNPVPPGSYDPVEEARLIQREVDEWFYSVVKGVWERFIRKALVSRNPLELLVQNLSGLSVSKHHVVEAISRAGLSDKKFTSWTQEDIREFAICLRRVSKPIIIAANKADLDSSIDNVKRLREEFGDEWVVPVSAIAELVLKKAVIGGYIEYLPGDNSFRIVDENRLNQQQRRGLEYIMEKVLRRWGSTGVQELLNRAVYNVLKLITVYPVEDHHKYTDHYGNVLPDAYLVPDGTTARQLAYMIHTDLGKTFLYAINAKTGEKIGEDYRLRDNDVVKIVATAAHH